MPVHDKKEIVIKDACILFDLVDLNLLEDFFQLELNAFTTPQVIGEITNEQQRAEIEKYIENGKLQIDTEGAIDDISSLNDQYPGLSFADSSVLELAIRINAVIYSSDGALRKATIKKGLVVRGVLWVIQNLYEKGFLEKQVAMDKLKQYEEINNWAPKKEIEILKAKILTE